MNRYTMFDDNGKKVILDLAEVDGKYEAIAMYTDGTEVKCFRSLDYQLALSRLMDWTHELHWEKPVKITGKYLKLQKDLAIAKAIGRQAEDKYLAENNYNDGGTCNFDAPYVLMPRANKKIMHALNAFEWYKSRFVLPVDTRCQGYGRTKNAEAMCKALKDMGYECDVYYQMD